MGHNIISMPLQLYLPRIPVTKEARPPHSAYSFHIYKAPRTLQMSSTDSNKLFLQIPDTILWSRLSVKGIFLNKGETCKSSGHKSYHWKHDNLHKRIMDARKEHQQGIGLSLRSRARNIYMISSLSDRMPEGVRWLGGVEGGICAQATWKKQHMKYGQGIHIHTNPIYTSHLQPHVTIPHFDFLKVLER